MMPTKPSRAVRRYKPRYGRPGGRRLLAVEVTPEIDQALDWLADRRAASTGQNPRRLAGPLVCELILAAYHAATAPAE